MAAGKNFPGCDFSNPAMWSFTTPRYSAVNLHQNRVDCDAALGDRIGQPNAAHNTCQRAIIEHEPGSDNTDICSSHGDRDVVMIILKGSDGDVVIDQFNLF